jgi:alkylation response protein AidB-like acyl-CoA dehydrogenase
MTWDNTQLFTDDEPADRQFRQEVRAWMEHNAPRELCHRAERPTPADLKPWHRRLYEKGWIAPHWPKEHGGMGATLTQQIILFEEMSRIGVPTPFPHGLNFFGPILMEAGTPAQKARHVPGILTGEVTWCQGYSEAEAGSDLANLRTTGEVQGDHLVINGHKLWTTNGHHADWMFALVRTDSQATPRHAGLTLVLIDLRSPGVTVRPIPTIRGDAELAEETFENVRVPLDNVVGGLNQGWKVANRVLGSERFTTGHPRNAAVLLNRARAVAQHTGARTDPMFCARLAALEIDLVAFTAYYHHAAKLQARGRAPASMAQVIKISGGELGQKASELLMDAAGLQGIGVEPMDLSSGLVDVAADLFEMRRLTVGSGTVEVQRNVLAKRVLDMEVS